MAGFVQGVIKCHLILGEVKQAANVSGQIIATSPQKVADFREMGPLISGKSRLVTYSNLARSMLVLRDFPYNNA